MQVCSHLKVREFLKGGGTIVVRAFRAQTVEHRCASSLCRANDPQRMSHVNEAITLAQARTWVRAFTNRHSENFSVLTMVLPKALHSDFAAVYAFCRVADDLADETGNTPEARMRSLLLLRAFSQELFISVEEHAGTKSNEVKEGGGADKAKQWPHLFVALSDTIQRHQLTLGLFTDLLDAFMHDQRVRRYETWDQLIAYSAKSANPVGRLVLILGGHRPPREVAENAALFAASDHICTALQLANFWQDPRRDFIERDRIYLPLRDMGRSEEQLGEWMEEETPEARRMYADALRPLVDRTWGMFREGDAIFSTLNPDLHLAVRLFAAGGKAILRKIEAMDYRTLWARPRLGKIGKGLLIARAVLGLRL